MKSNFDYEIHEEPTAMDADNFDIHEVTMTQVKVTNLTDPNSCWNKFKEGLRSIWATKHTENTKENRELFIKTTLRELVIYIIFLTVLVIISFGMTTVQAFYFTNLLNNLFTTGQFNDNTGSFSTSATESDFWKFLTGPLVNGLYWTTWYNNMNVSSNQINFIYYENKLLGLPRIRQVRVGNKSCSIPADFKNDITYCYAMYSKSSESTDPFGLMNSTAWTYTNESVLNAGTFQGTVTKYGAGGYYVDLALNQADSLNILSNLFNNLWIDRGTRAIIVDFTIFNANINLFCAIKLVGEFPATGGLLTSYEFRTVKLIRYVGPIDFFVLACEILFLVFIIYYTVEESLEIKSLKFEYFFSVWNILDILVIIFSLICCIFNMYRTLTVQNILQDLISNVNQHPNFEYLSFWQLQFNYLIAITLFLAWVKIFKYISFNKTMTQLTATLDRCSKDLAGFSIMFFIIFLAFAQLGYLIFGAQVSAFSTVITSIYTLFRIILGDFDFSQLEQAHRVLGPLYFVFYVFFVFFVLFNMFLAIINDTYSEVKEDLAKQKNEFEISDYLKERTDMMLAKLHLKRDKIIDIQKAMLSADANNDGVMDFDEWKTELKARGYGDAEIEAVFAKYDTDGDRVLDQEEQLAMAKELEDQKDALNNEITIENEEGSKGNNENSIAVQSISMEEYRALSRRIGRMDSNTKGIVMQIDSVLESLENMEKTKANSRETMGIILKTLTSTDEFNEEERKRKLESLIQSEINKLSQNSRSNLRPKSGFRN